MIELRDYQMRAIDALHQWFAAGNAGHPCVVMPTGSGKSHIIAAFCKHALKQWPETRILMLTHVKELIEQNAEKMRQHWPGAPMGIYSAGLGKKELYEPITFAGIQSIKNKADKIGHVDLILIDECHLVNHHDEGVYRDFINALTSINPALRIIGLTATPYRLGHGLIIDTPALFSDLIEPVTIAELIDKGHISPLLSKYTELQIDLSKIHKRGGEFIESELQSVMNTDARNISACKEIIALAENRRSWLIFCTGVNHAENISNMLNGFGVLSACITGETPKHEREQIIAEFRSGKLRALANANVLTTGFDAPNIDLIAMLRPTNSPSLYIQMAGRGLRKKEYAKNCLVLDFAGVVKMHGPITAIIPPAKGKKGNGEAPAKVCESCHEICHISTRFCTACGAEFPMPKSKSLRLHDDDIMGSTRIIKMKVTRWKWRVKKLPSDDIEIKLTYYGDLSDIPVTRIFNIEYMKPTYVVAEQLNKFIMFVIESFKTGITHIPKNLCNTNKILKEIKGDIESAYSKRDSTRLEVYLDKLLDGLHPDEIRITADKRKLVDGYR